MEDQETTVEQKIPKIIHYCWFGGNSKPQLVINCIESWRKFCPDYQIVEWNETNFDIHSNAFVEEAYQAKKWAFVSDYVRAIVLYQNGGIYMDADFELLQTLDSLVVHSAFAGFEVNDTIGSSIIGCEKEHALIFRVYDYYRESHFCRGGAEGITTGPVVLTNTLKEEGLKLNGKKQSAFGCMVFPKKVFYPTGIGWVFGKYCSKTIGIHHYMDSWGKNPDMKERSRFSKLRLCFLYYGRNILGTGTMYDLGQRMRNNRQK